MQRWAYYKLGEPALWPISKAADMWWVGPTLPLPLTQNPNGGARPPLYGDIMVVAATSANPPGHTAIVSSVTATSVTRGVVVARDSGGSLPPALAIG